MLIFVLLLGGVVFYLIGGWEFVPYFYGLVFLVWAVLAIGVLVTKKA